MSKHWDPKRRGTVVPFRRQVPARKRRRRGLGIKRGDLFGMAVIGLVIGGTVAFTGTGVGPDIGTSGEAMPFGSGAERGGPAHVRVIDGDTFDYRGMRVRVADIDTPEVRGQCAYESGLAARATARMRALLSEGPFELHPLGSGRDEDRYGRKLRIVTRNGRSLGDRLVAEGWRGPGRGGGRVGARAQSPCSSTYTAVNPRLKNSPHEIPAQKCTLLNQPKSRPQRACYFLSLLL